MVCILTQPVALQGVGVRQNATPSQKAVPFVPKRWNIPSAVGRALNNSGFFQHSLGPHAPRCALKKCLNLSARDGHQRENVAAMA